MKKTLFFWISVASMMVLSGCTTPASSSSASSNKGSSSVSESSSSGQSSSSTASSSSSSETANSSSQTQSSSSSSEAPAISVTLTGEDDVEIGKTITLSAQVSGSDVATVSWSTSAPSIATVDNGVVTGVAAGETIIRATSTADSTKYAEKTITVKEAAAFKARLALTKTDGSAVDSIKEGSGAYLLTVTPENLPQGKTLADCTFAYPANSALGYFNDLETPAKNKKLYATNYAGTNDIKVSVKCGEETAVAEMKLTIAKDQGLYTKISTVNDFINVLLKATIGRFEMAANLDLGGVNTNGATSNITFNGELDGMGYTVKNFVANPKTDGTFGGLWTHVGSGLIRNLHLIGTENQTAGWGSLLGKEVQDMAVVEDCLFEATSTVDTSKGIDWTWQRSGIFAAFLKGTVKNCVAVNQTANNQMLDVAPYASKSGAVIDNVYTATKDNALIIPFDPNGGTADWSGTAAVTNLHSGMVWASSKASDYALDGSVWTLQDGKMPALAHDGDSFVKAEPKLTLSTSTTDLTVGGANATITASVANLDGDVTYSFEGSEGYADIIDVNVDATNKNVFTVAPVAKGTASVTIKATSGETVLTSSPVAFTVAEQGTGPIYTIPDNALEIKDKATFLTFFDKGASGNAKNAYLSADIDLGGLNVDSIMQAGEYAATFEGQGHKIFNFTASRPLWNIVKATAEIRNLVVQCDDFTGSGFGTLAFQNSGTMKNVDVAVIINSASINSWGPCAFVGAGKFIDCDSTITINKGCNTLYAIARADAGSTFTNCTYFVDGTDGTVGTAVSASAASGVTLRSSK